MKSIKPLAGARPVEALEPRMFLSSAPLLTVANLDILPGPERMVFNRIQREPPHSEVGPGGQTIYPPVNVVHDKATLQLHNSGNMPLLFSSMTINGPWRIINTPARSLLPGQSTDVTLQFVATSEPAHSYNETNGPFNPNYGGAWFGSLTIKTNDPKNSSYVEQLAGWWQYQSEASTEPSLETMVNLLFNYKTNIGPPQADVLAEPNNQRKLYGEEVLSYYWKAAKASQPVYVRSIASFHQQGNPVILAWYKKGQRNGPTLFTTAGVEGQSFLPHEQGNMNAPAAATFSPGTAAFGFRVDYERSDDTMNMIGGGGHHVRFYPVRDHTGAIIANTYLMVMDYDAGAGAVSENFDFQDQVYVITNVQPAGL